MRPQPRSSRVLHDPQPPMDPWFKWSILFAVCVAVIWLVSLLHGCTPAPLQTTVHVNTYRGGTTDVVEHRLLYRGPAPSPAALADLLKLYGLAQAPTATEAK